MSLNSRNDQAARVSDRGTRSVTLLNPSRWLRRDTPGPPRTRRVLTDRDDFSEWPLSFRTAKDAVRARQPSSRHTPSHLTVWLVLHTGNCKDTRGRRASRAAGRPAGPSGPETEGPWSRRYLLLFKGRQGGGDEGEGTDGRPPGRRAPRTGAGGPAVLWVRAGVACVKAAATLSLTGFLSTQRPPSTHPARPSQPLI